MNNMHYVTKYVAQLYLSLQILQKEHRERLSKKKVHFLEIAYGSLMEVFCQLTIAYDLGYISQEELAKARAQSYKITKLISGLRTSFEKINTP